MRETLVSCLLSSAEADSDILLLTGDLGFGVFDSFASKLPAQFINVGVAEQNMTGLAAGLALEGKSVFTYSIGNFPTLRCLEQIRNDILYHQLPVNIISVGSGFSYGALGMSHHSTEDIGIMRSLPGIRIFSPCDTNEVSSIFSLLSSDPAPSYIRLDKSKLETASPEPFIPFHPRCVRTGADIVFLATGGIVQEALDAAELLHDQGLSPSVYSVHTLKPFDNFSLLNILNSHRYVFTIEEHSPCGGLGSIVAESIVQLGFMPSVFYRFSLPDSYSSIVGSQSYLRKQFSLDSQSVAAKVSSFVFQS